jgi:hypothetical protein
VALRARAIFLFCLVKFCFKETADDGLCHEKFGLCGFDSDSAFQTPKNQKAEKAAKQALPALQ